MYLHALASLEPSPRYVFPLCRLVGFCCEPRVSSLPSGLDASFQEQCYCSCRRSILYHQEAKAAIGDPWPSQSTPSSGGGYPELRHTRRPTQARHWFSRVLERLRSVVAGSEGGDRQNLSQGMTWSCGKVCRRAFFLARLAWSRLASYFLATAVNKRHHDAMSDEVRAKNASRTSRLPVYALL